MSSEILDTELLRARMMQAGYGQLTEKDVRRIHVERPVKNSLHTLLSIIRNRKDKTEDLMER